LHHALCGDEGGGLFCLTTTVIDFPSAPESKAGRGVRDVKIEFALSTDDGSQTRWATPWRSYKRE
jgi:hypothetical protein